MRKVLIALFVLLVLALNWAALHDILKGEANVWAEWAFVIVSVLLLAVYLIRKMREAKSR